MKLNTLTIQGEYFVNDFSKEFIEAMRDSSPNEFYARICSIFGC
jgi:hypothetical protein